MYEASCVMKRDVLTITGDVTAEQAIRLLMEHRISGIPVVDEDDCLIGIVSEFQLLETIYCSRFRAMRIRDIMTKNVITVDPDTLLSGVVDLMVLHRIRRIPVTKNAKIVGIVSRRDLLTYSIEAGDALYEFLEKTKAPVCSS